MKFLIYGLCDPRSEELRYVGQSTKGLKRPEEHWTSKRCLAARDHCHSWVRQVLESQQIPQVVVLEELSEDSTRDQLDEAEVFWIGYFRMIGCRLTNKTAGGKGTRGLEPWCKGKKLSPEHRAKISSSNLGRPCTPSMKEAISRAHKGKIESPETRLKKSLAHKGKVFSEETRQKISLALRGKRK